MEGALLRVLHPNPEKRELHDSDRTVENHSLRARKKNEEEENVATTTTSQQQHPRKRDFLDSRRQSRQKILQNQRLTLLPTQQVQFKLNPNSSFIHP